MAETPPVEPNSNVSYLLSAYSTHNGLPTVPTGIPRLDQWLQGGMIPGTLSIIAGRAGEGKTSIALTMSRRMAEQGFRVVFFSLEMSAHELTERLVCQWLSKTSLDLRLHRDAKTLEALVRPLVAQAKRQLNLQILDEGGGGIADIRLLLESFKRKDGLVPDVLVIDHLQQVWMPEGTSRADGIAAYLRDLKEVAKEFKLVVILCSQLNRQVYQTKDKSGAIHPQLYHLKSSGGIEEVSDLVLICWRKSMDEHLDEQTQSQDTEFAVFIAKNRSGPIGEITLKFRPQHYDFVEYESSWDAPPPSGGQDRAAGELAV